MALRYRDKNGKTISVSMFDLLGNQKKVKAVIEGTKRGIEEKKPADSSGTTKEAEISADAGSSDNKMDNGEVRQSDGDMNIEDIAKERAALQARMKELGALQANIKKNNKHPQEEKHETKEKEKPKPNDNRGKKNSNTTKAGDKTNKINPYLAPLVGLLHGTQSNTDPTIQDATAARSDLPTLDTGDETRPPLTFQQCAMIMRLHDHYDQCKYLMLCSKFFDVTGIPINPEEIKQIILADQSRRSEAKKESYNYSIVSAKIFDATGIRIDSEDVKRMVKQDLRARGPKVMDSKGQSQKS